MLTFIRRTPSAFWIALLGVGLFLFVYFSGVWEMSLFALILVLAYLAVAVLMAVHSQGTRMVAFVVAALVALLEVWLMLEYWTGEKPVPEVALIHATGAVIAAAAAASALLAAIRTPRPASQMGAAG
jgi:hypothetical protein